MAFTVVIAGQSYVLPNEGDTGWGPQTSDWMTAVSTQLLQRSGGTFSLSAEVNFGPSFGLKSLYFKSRADDPAVAGVIRLGSGESISWRNDDGDGDLPLTTDSNDNLTFNGQIIPGQTGTVQPDEGGTGITSYTEGDMLYASAVDTLSKLTIGAQYTVLQSNGTIPTYGLLTNNNIDAAAAIAYSKLSLTDSIVNADINASAAIALSKLAALTGSKLLESSSGGVIAVSTGTGFVKAASGTPSYQAQVNLASEVTGILPKANGGSGQDNSSLTFPSTGTLATLAGAETLSNKSFSDPITLAEVSTPATPSSGFGKIYFKSDGFLYQLNDDGTETKVGAGSGGVNYITNGDAESNTAGWLTYSNTAQAVPVDGAGGTATGVTFTRTTSSPAPLRGVGSFVLSKDASNRQGKGVAYDFEIADADLAQPLTIAFDYHPTSDFHAGTGPSDISDVVVYLYDRTNNQVIQAAPFVLAGGSGANQKFSATFQTNYNSNLYRLIFHIATTNALAWDLEIDDVLVGPQVQLYGSPISDWQAYTPTIAGWDSTSSVSGQWRRVGSNMEIQVKFTGSSANGSEARCGLPSGYSTQDTSVIPSIQVCGDFGGSANGAVAPVLLVEPSVTYLTFAFQGTSNNALTKVTGGAMGAATFSVHGTVPIAGWGSNVVMSQDASTRVVALRVAGDPASASSGNPIIFPTVTFDTHSAYNASTGIYTAPVSGYYRVHGAVSSPNATISLNVFKNGVGYGLAGTTDSNGEGTFSTSVQLNAGDTVSLRPSGTFDGGNDCNMSIERISGPAAIAASETVACRYTNSSASAFGNGSSEVAMSYANRTFDTHGSFNGTTFTAPVSGFYQVSASFGTASFIGGNAARRLYLYAKKNNGAGIVICATVEAQTGTSSPRYGAGGTLIQLNAGETIAFSSYSDSASITLDSDPTINYISIFKIGGTL